MARNGEMKAQIETLASEKEKEGITLNKNRLRLVIQLKQFTPPSNLGLLYWLHTFQFCIINKSVYSVAFQGENHYWLHTFPERKKGKVCNQ